MSVDAAVLSDWNRLRAEVKAHKSAIDRHRKELQRSAAALATFEAECKARGIALVTVAPVGVGALHGPNRTHP